VNVAGASPARQLPRGGFIRYFAGWLPAAQAQALGDWLRACVHWEQAELQLFGRAVREPRVSAWFSEHDYTYSGRTLRAQPFPAPIEELRARLARELEQPFNSVLVNRYRDGNDSMGFHADDEPELGKCPLIASVSLGATRRFVVRAKARSERETAEYDLENGSLLVMGGALQHHYKHALPKRPRERGERINLTFRTITSLQTE
jgi:alkylated DNA repair dioxygenase AlkB